jgi:hypothetical protein
MPSQRKVNSLTWPRWAQALLIALLVLIMSARLVMIVEGVVSGTGVWGPEGRQPGITNLDPNAEPGFGLVVDATPNGELAKAGVSVGDHVRFERRYQQVLVPVAGERIDFVLDHDGARSQRHIIVEPWHWNERERQAAFAIMLVQLTGLMAFLIGCFILWRGWGNRAAMLLGAAVTNLASVPSFYPEWMTSPALFFVTLTLDNVGWFLVALLPAFAMYHYEESAGKLPRWQWRTLAVFLGTAVISTAIFVFNVFTWTTWPFWGEGSAAEFGLPIIAIGMCIVYLVVGWRKCEASERNRFAVIIFAFAAFLLVEVISTIVINGPTRLAERASSYLPYLHALTGGVVAPGLLAYAVLRHKLFDLGFAVNRTLVFGAIGVLLLVSFALIEWAIKQAIPKVWYGGSVYISAGIAVGLYLAFNRIHHKVEHAIERLFFHKWQLNEAVLKRFVAAVAHVEKPEALAGNFVAELTRFTGGAKTAIYARTAEGHYDDASGANIDADDPALAAMRAEQGAVVPAELGSPLEATLALPMMHQAALAGFVLLGPKPTGEDYRPDEIEILGWATQQVGLDMQAIRVRDLEQSVFKLEARNANLSEILAKAAVAEA